MDVDFVVAWVDGADPAHAAKRRRFAKGKQPPASASAFRYRDDGEVRLCLRSITNHAPWARRVWLVTDDQFPPYIDRERAREAGIEAVDHRAIFAGFEGLLPTFNSLAIETMLWRIPGLADRFVYLQDDMVLTGPTTPAHFFPGGLPLLRGKMTDAAALGAGDTYSRNKAAGARLAGAEGDRVFSAAHVAHPLLRPVMAELFERHREAFGRNAGFRFRDRSQFSPAALHDNAALLAGRAVLKGPPSDWVHLSVAGCRTGSAWRLRRRLAAMRRRGALLACANDFGALTERLPGAAAAFERVTGPPAPYEKAAVAAPGAPREGAPSWRARAARALDGLWRPFRARS